MKRKQKNNRCPLAQPGRDEKCPLETARMPGGTANPAQVVVVRTERRSWLTIAITSFGALLLRYLKTVRERARTDRKR
jgi:hypothetical protein